MRRHLTVGSVAQSARSPRLDSICALVVDDDPETREALRSLPASLGASIREAKSAEDAIAVLAEMNPDVLISALGMPGRDGYSLIKEIRAREKSPGLRSICWRSR